MSTEQITRPAHGSIHLSGHATPAQPCGTRGMVGRDVELAVLERLVRDPQAAVVLVEGDAGAGTSSLLAAARAQAARQEWVVLSGCAGGPDAAPLGLFYDAFGPTSLLDALLVAESWITRDGSPAQRQQLHQRVRAALATTAAGRGLLLTLDDLQWADPWSVDLLVGLLRHPPAARLLLVLGCRSDRLPPAVERALGDVVRLRPAALDDAALRQLLPTASPRRRRALLAATAGNPRYLRVLADLPTSALTDLTEQADPTTPSGLLDAAAAAEVHSLPPSTRTTAGVAALLGEYVDSEAVATVGGADHDQVLADLDDLIARDLLCQVDGRLRFRHPLVRATAYRLARPAWRVAVHRRAGRWLADRGAPVLARAPHVAASAGIGDHDAADLLATAAHEVLHDDPAAAARWLETALRIRPAPALPGEPTTAGTGDSDRLLLSRAHLLAGAPDRARKVLSVLVKRPGPHHLRATILLARLEAAQGAFQEAQTVLRVGLGDLPAADGRAALEAELDAIALAHGHAHAMLRVAGTVTTPTAGTGPAAAAHAVVRAAGALALGAGSDERLLVQRATELVDGLDERDMGEVLHHLPLLVRAEHHIGRSADAAGHAERGVATAVRLGCREEVPALRLAMAAVALEQGQLAVASQAIEDALDDARELDQHRSVAVATMLRCLLTAWRDGPSTALRLLDEAPGTATCLDPWSQAVTVGAHAEVLLLAGMPGEAHRMCRAAALGPARTLAHPQLWVLAAGAALDDKDITGARVLVERADRLLAGSTSTGPIRGRVDIARARVYLAVHDLPKARAAARAAVTALDAAGDPVTTARARLVSAEAAAAAGDVPAAAREWDLAAEGLESAGAWWFARHVADQAQRRRHTAPTPCDSLSRREWEIAQLIGQGLTNRAIAEQLVLSVRTVDSHVARILAKLDVPSRLGVLRALDSTHRT